MTANSSPDESSRWDGHWAWVHVSGVEGPELGHHIGRIGDTGVGLPPAFSVNADRLGLWARINEIVGTMLDVYENDELDDPEQIVTIAGICESFFSDEADRRLATEIGGFLRECARSGTPVEFWL